MIITVQECVENIDKYRGCRVIYNDLEYYIFGTDDEHDILLVSDTDEEDHADMPDKSEIFNSLLHNAACEGWKYYRWIYQGLPYTLELMVDPNDTIPPLENSEYINKLFTHLNLTLKSYDNT